MTDAAERERLACLADAEAIDRVRLAQAQSRRELQTALYKEAESFRVIAALLRASAIPDGWRLVPVEPTEAALAAVAHAAVDFYSRRGPYPRSRAMWAAMLAAAPQPKEPRT